MNSFQNSNSQCRELERLAAAATRDYPNSPSLHHNIEPSLPEHDQDITIHTISSNTQPQPDDSSVTHAPQIISYVETHLPRNHIVPVRTYETLQTHIHEPDSSNCVHSSRIVIVNNNGASHPTSVQFSRPVNVSSVENVHCDSVDTSIQIPQEQYSKREDSVRLIHFINTTQVVQRGNSHNVTKMKDLQSESTVVPQNVSYKQRVVNKSFEKTGRLPSDIPSPVKNEDNKIYYPCRQCNKQLDTPEHWKQHHLEHLTKRKGLSLEMKIEIIKRINDGEKKADMAEEYNVNRSTIKSIMKKSDSYLTCWKKGMYNPDSKRLKGPKREDIEAALYAWYLQAIESKTPVSGPILCHKAMDFASRLGHHDFKPSHGWLDRFKKRKKIVFGKRPVKKNAEVEVHPPNSTNAVLSQIVNEKEPCDIFAVEEIGIFYRASPTDIRYLKGKKCQGGIYARDRLTIFVCANMAGTEKFPLLVIGKCQKLRCLKSSKYLPVHFIYNEKSWVTVESFGAWLLDIDSWFVKQNRKVYFLAPHLPVHITSGLQLRSIKFSQIPQMCPFPLQHLTHVIFKRLYRFGLIKEWLQMLSKKKPEELPAQLPEIPINTCLNILYSAWCDLSESAIINSFQKTGFNKYSIWTNSDLPNLTVMQDNFYKLASLVCFQGISFEDFVHFDDGLLVCDLMDEEEILAKVRGIVASEDEDESRDEESRSGSNRLNSLGSSSLLQVEDSLDTLRRHIQYKEGAQELFRLVSDIESHIKRGFVMRPMTSFNH